MKLNMCPEELIDHLKTLITLQPGSTFYYRSVNHHFELCITEQDIHPPTIIEDAIFEWLKQRDEYRRGGR